MSTHAPQDNFDDAVGPCQDFIAQSKPTTRQASKEVVAVAQEALVEEALVEEAGAETGTKEEAAEEEVDNLVKIPRG
jgi:hypothetical protein